MYINGESRLLLTNVSFVENVARQGDGGAIHGASVSALNLIDAIFRCNEARHRGGGLVLSVTDEAVIDSCLLEDNSGIFGGGIYSSAGSGSVSIINSTINGNSAGANDLDSRTTSRLIRLSPDLDPSQLQRRT